VGTRLAAGEKKVVAESKVVRRLVVSSIAWLDITLIYRETGRFKPPPNTGGVKRAKHNKSGIFGDRVIDAETRKEKKSNLRERDDCITGESESAPGSIEHETIRVNLQTSKRPTAVDGEPPISPDSESARLDDGCRGNVHEV
jgi:hypothetical protein